MKVDLVMWTLNGAKTLPFVLDRINNVVPDGMVNQKLIVDDGSVDNTVSIAKSCGWNVIRNEGKGISDGANTALKLVETEVFCSFEQDVLLSPAWWTNVSPMIIGKDDVAAACGLRFLPQSNFCFNVEPYGLTRRQIDFYGSYGKTLDNTFWNTQVLRSVGGFPKLTYAGIDTYLLNLFESKGYEWLVNYDVKSLHLHDSLLNELKHYYFYGLSLPQLYKRLGKITKIYQNETLSRFVFKLAKSPASGLRMALKMRDARLTVAYPALRLCWLLGYTKGMSLESN